MLSSSRVERSGLP